MNLRFLRYFSARFIFAFARNLLLKIRYGGRIRINPFKVYLELGVRVRISGCGRIDFDASGERIFISRGCDITASGGSVTLGAGFFMNKHCTLVAHERIEIGSHVMFGPNVSVFDSDHKCIVDGTPFSKQGYETGNVRLGDNVWIGQNSVVTKGSHIENDVLVAANSIVRGTLLSGHLYAGIPVRQIKPLPRGQAD